MSVTASTTRLTGDERTRAIVEAARLRERKVKWSEVLDAVGIDQGASRFMCNVREYMRDGGRVSKTRELVRSVDEHGKRDDGRGEQDAGEQVEDVTMHVDLPKRKKASRVLLRAAVYDIEVTDFKTEGYGGIMIMCCVLPLDSERVKTFGLRFDDQRDDRRVMDEIRAELAQYDILIGHNIASFDANWLNSRLMYHGMSPMRTHLYFDTYQVAKGLGIKTWKNLGNLLDYFGLEGEKTSIYRTSWMNITSPHKSEFDRAYQDIQYHCEQDVIGNRNLFDVMYPYALANGRGNPFKLSKMRTVDSLAPRVAAGR